MNRKIHNSAGKSSPVSMNRQVEEFEYYYDVKDFIKDPSSNYAYVYHLKKDCFIFGKIVPQLDKKRMQSLNYGSREWKKFRLIDNTRTDLIEKIDQVNEYFYWLNNCRESLTIHCAKYINVK